MKRIYLLSCLIVLFLNTSTTFNFGVYSYHTVYLYNFIKYIDWPENKKDGVFLIGVLGQSPILTELSDMASKKKLGNRIIEVKKITAAEVTACNIVFIPESNVSQTETIAEISKNKGVLIITETPGMSKKGSAINFIFIDGKLKFEINKNAAAQANLNISTELIKLAISTN